MEQHPVPQHIAAFKFKLFGNLTAKQFITLAIPLGLAALIFFSPLPAIIRLPVSLVVGIFAFILALIPIGGRSADQWFIAFVKAVLSPTQRIWIKEKEVPEFLNMATRAPQVEKIPDEVAKLSKEKLTAFLKSLPKESNTALDIYEQTSMQNIDFGYETPVMPQIVKFQESETAPLASEKPQIIEKPQPLKFQRSTQIQNIQRAPKDVTNIGVLPPPISWPTPGAYQPGAFGGQSTWPTSTFGGNYNFEIAVSGQPNMQMAQVAAPSGQSFAGPPVIRPRIAAHAKPYIVPGVEKRLAKIPIFKKPQGKYPSLIKRTPAVNLASETNFSIENIIPIRTPDNKIRFVHGIGKTRARKLHFAPPEGFDLSKLPIRGEKRFEVSEELKHHLKLEDEGPEVILPTDIWKKEAAKVKKLPKKAASSLPKKTVQVPKSTHSVKKQVQKKLAQTSQASLNEAFLPQFAKSESKTQSQTPSLASIIPLTNMPNVISGLVSDDVANPLTGAVLVIRDSNGIPQRALKTNKLGQFLSATPLQNGAFTIETEAEGAKFEPVTFEANGKVIVPIEIRAKEI